MNIEEVRARLAKIVPELHRLGVTDLRVFGSVARGQANPDSDIDLLVQLRDCSYESYCAVLSVIEEAIQGSVDLVMVEALKPRYKDRILNEAMRVA